MTIQTIRDLINSARKAKENNIVNSLQAVLSSVQTTMGRTGKEPTEDEILKILSKEKAVFQEQVDLAKAAGQSWVDLEIRRDYLETLLPKPIPAENYEVIAMGAIVATDAKNAKDMGRVLKALTVEFGTRIEMKKMSEIVKNLLSLQ